MYNADGISLASTKVFDSIETQKIYLCLLLARLTTSDMYSGWSRSLSDQMTLTNSSKSSAQGDCPDGAVGQNCLPIQEAQVQSLVREDRTRLGATKPLHHNYRPHPVGSTRRKYWAQGLQPLKPEDAVRLVSPNYWACVPQLLKPACPGVCMLQLQNNWWAPTTEARATRACGPQQKKAPHGEARAQQLESSPHSLQLEKVWARQGRPSTDKNK